MIKSFVRDKILLRTKMLHDFPRTINIELTTCCNLRCKMCPHSSMSDFGDMDFELFKKIVDQVLEFADEKTAFCLVGLGEPLLYPKLTEAIEYIKMKLSKAHISFASNGTLLDWSRFIVLSQLLGERDGILISLNVNNREDYEKLIGSDKYETVVENIKGFLELRSRKVPLTVQYLDTHIGVGVKKFKEYWSPYLKKGDRIYIRPLVNWNGKIDMGNFAVQEKRKRFPCIALWTSISIDRKGNVYPCCEGFSSRENGSLMFGNINERSLTEIYSSKINAIRKQHLEGKWIGTCSKCDMWRESPNIWLKLGKRWF